MKERIDAINKITNLFLLSNLADSDYDFRQNFWKKVFREELTQDSVYRACEKLLHGNQNFVDLVNRNLSEFETSLKNSRYLCVYTYYVPPGPGGTDNSYGWKIRMVSAPDYYTIKTFINEQIAKINNRDCIATDLRVEEIFVDNPLSYEFGEICVEHLKPRERNNDK